MSWCAVKNCESGQNSKEIQNTKCCNVRFPKSAKFSELWVASCRKNKNCINLNDGRNQ